MELGSLQERYLSRSVIKHVRKQNKELRQGAFVGSDFARLGDIISADGCGESIVIAWNKGRNNFACSGGSCQGARLLMCLPEEIKEGKLKEYMAAFNKLAEAEHVQVLGGHSEVCSNVDEPVFYITFLGVADNYETKKKEIKPGFKIVMTKYAALLGTDIILNKNMDKLGKRFAKSFLEGAFAGAESYSVTKDAAIAKKYAYYMHDVSHGGMYGALWQLGSFIDKGISIDHKKIEINQQTIEICEYFDINPYLLDGTGSLLIITDDEENLCNDLMANGITAAVIGEVTEGNEKVVTMNEIDKRTLAPVNGDERYKNEAYNHRNNCTC